MKQAFKYTHSEAGRHALDVKIFSDFLHFFFLSFFTFNKQWPAGDDAIVQNSVDMHDISHQMRHFFSPESNTFIANYSCCCGLCLNFIAVIINQKKETVFLFSVSYELSTGLFLTWYWFILFFFSFCFAWVQKHDNFNFGIFSVFLGCQI